MNRRSRFAGSTAIVLVWEIAMRITVYCLLAWLALIPLGVFAQMYGRPRLRTGCLYLFVGLPVFVAVFGDALNLTI